jgi:hypothetical protein
MRDSREGWEEDDEDRVNMRASRKVGRGMMRIEKGREWEDKGLQQRKMKIG